MAVQHALLPLAATPQFNAARSSSLCCLPNYKSPICPSSLLPKASSRTFNQLVSQLHRPQREFRLTVQQQQRPLVYRSLKTNRRVPNIVAADGDLVFGCKIPQHYFVTSGFGETDEGFGDDPYETGSYDLALQDAEIADFNIQTYTSVMPLEAIFLTLTEAQPYFKHGAVLECIMASMSGGKGDRISAGVGRMKVRKISDQTPIGGYAAEYKGHATEELAREILKDDLQGIFARRFKAGEYEIYDEEYEIKVHEVAKSFGTVLASICFISFIEPPFVISPSSK